MPQPACATAAIRRIADQLALALLAFVFSFGAP